MKQLQLLPLLFLFCTSSMFAQDYKFGKVSKEEVAQSTYEKDTSANAVILYKNRNTHFEHQHPDGWVLVTEIHERIKILNKDGLDYGTKEISLYESKNDEEKVSSIKGITYNMVGDKLETAKLKRSSIFKEEKSENWMQHTITMPDVKVGAVVEWTYKITSPFWKIDDVIIQDDIPTKYFHAKIETIQYFNFKRLVRGHYSIQPKDYSEPRTVTVSWESDTNGALTQATRSSTIQTKEYVNEYTMQDIPALKEEPYVDNIDNYRFLINYELMTVNFPNGGIKDYSTSWEKVVKTINESQDFGKQLSSTGFLDDDADLIKSKTNNQKELMGEAFDRIKNKMSWNKRYGKYTKQGLRRAYKESTGNVSEINLMLVGLLRACGVKANPVLVSTRQHGIPAFPTIEGFNYVIACAEINGEEFLLDATDKLSYPNVLPQRVLNWEGTMVMKDDRTRKVNLYPKKVSQQNVIMSVNISEDGSIKGKQTRNYTDLDAMSYRKVVEKHSKETYLESLLNAYAFDDLTDFSQKNVEDLEKPTFETYAFELDEGVDIVGNEIYFSPLFFLKTDENPFKLDERNYPVNFVYPLSRTKRVSVKIPEGYKVTSTPEPIKMSLPDQMGSFLFNISVVEGGLNVVSTFKLNTAIVPSFKYLELKEFYNQRVLKETEKVVLTKI